LPPASFVTVTMQFAMMSPAWRNGKLVTDLAPERAVLCKPQMICRDRYSSALSASRHQRMEPWDDGVQQIARQN